MTDDRARSAAKASAQAAIDSASDAVARGVITSVEWQHRVTDALARAYLGESDPRWQSGFDGDATLWREARELVLDAIPADGSLLDVGCANGHLLECLAAWSNERGRRLTLSGLELNPALADAARRRLPQLANRIFTGNVSDWSPPHRFTYVRTGLEYVPAGDESALIARLLQYVVDDGGRLLIGPVNEDTLRHTVEAARAGGATETGVASATDHRGKTRYVVWSTRTSADGTGS